MRNFVTVAEATPNIAVRQATDFRFAEQRFNNGSRQYADDIAVFLGNQSIRAMSV